MVRVVPVESLDLSDLIPFKTLRQPVEHLRKGLFVAEGEKVVRRLLASGLPVRSLLLTPEWLESLRPVLAGLDASVSAFVAQRAVLERIVGFHLHQGIMALAGVPALHTLDGILASSPPRFFVAIDGLTNAENIGVLVRTCAAFGVQAVIAGETSSSPYLRRAVRNSMGAIFTMPVVASENLVADLKRLRAAGIAVIAAHPHAQRIGEMSATGDVCVVFGSEGDGVRPEVLAACDTAAAIPMHPGVDSLNVATAAAVFLYEVARQREGR